MFTERDSFTKIIKEIIDKQITEKNLGLSIWRVTDIKSRDENGYITEYKVNVKHPNFKYTIDNVPILGIGLGHRKGMIKYPNIGDFVVIGYIDAQPYIIGTVYDYFTPNPDSIPSIKLNELAIVQKEKGSIILMKENNDVMIRASDINGDFNNGARIRINNDGSFKVFSKNNKGIECDANGNFTIYGVTINNLKVKGATATGGTPSHTHEVDINVIPINPSAEGTW